MRPTAHVATSAVTASTMTQESNTDRATAAKATIPAHRYISRTARTWLWPMSSRRWCRWPRSGANGDLPARVLRTTASTRSASGRAITSSGSAIGRNTTRPELNPSRAVLASNCPVTVMVIEVSSRPSSMAPVSPMNTLAGWKLWQRNPAHVPARMIAIIAG